MSTVSGYTIANIIEQNLENTEIADKVANLLKNFDGKQMSKRIETYISKTMPAFTVRYERTCGMFYLRLWGNGISYDNRWSFLLGYESQGSTFNFEDFLTKFNICYYSAAKERNVRRHTELKDSAWLENVADAINRANQARQDLETLLDYPETPDSFAIEKLVTK